MNANPTSRRWFTCTPVSFGGGADFFARDSGLLCRGFQRLGIESRAVMPGPPRPDDEPDLIRTGYRNLESADWWKSQHLDGVVLYAWGRPKFRAIARAIRRAGVFLVLNQDNGGLVSPLAGPAAWWREQRTLAGGARSGHLRNVVRGLTIGLFVTDPLRAMHLHQGDLIACVSPQAAEIYRKLCRYYGGKLADRIRVVPHPVEPTFAFHREPKLRQVICVGRWDDEIQKRPQLLIDAVGLTLASDPSVRFAIAGTLTERLRSWHAALSTSDQGRVALLGAIPRAALADAMRASEVFYSPSAYESFGVAAAEALCCGCSVVAAKSASMASFEWFASEASGTLAANRDAESHSTAILRELGQWRTGNRDPWQISTIWCRRLHAHHIAAALLQQAPR